MDHQTSRIHHIRLLLPVTLLWRDVDQWHRTSRLRERTRLMHSQATPSQFQMGAGSSNHSGLYSTTQFDTLSVLSRVYTRPNPKIELGPVDDSVSFVVVDGTKDDFPIVYCSQNFHKLTGYSREEIVGRNCRFLQYPPPDATGRHGGVTFPQQPHRSQAVEAFKRSLMLGQECQASLVNYRRDGEAFLNLISVVPIRWREECTGEQKEYYVGFQVDLNEALGGETQDHSRPRQPALDEPRGPGDETWAET
ncbi:hypothetical protein BS47DRAFT_1327177 [Hydnum rufescens UP504]|uniref:PAS domain-containing protein n=1 Tax=Hydnum rufescens UP504 TaxID=1448309 RepID=A0A9P6B330_9AGAM|nr:hypothetical protein BS47DRAFT_1327177 [Hydnum rufescens UP504]